MTAHNDLTPWARLNERNEWQGGNAHGVPPITAREEISTMTKQQTTTEQVAGQNWGPDEAIAFLVETGRFDIEQDNFGNIVIYVDLHEDDDGNLIAGTVGEDGPA